MAKTVDQIAFSIRDSIANYYPVAEDRLDIEFIYKKMDEVRAVLIKDLWKEKKYLDPQNYSFEKCLDIKRIDRGCNIQACIGADIYVDIPPVISYLNSHAISYFGTIDRLHPFVETNISGLMVSEYNLFTKQITRYMRIGNQVFINKLPTPNMQKVSMIAVFERPVEICNGGDIYPIPEEMIYQMELMIKKDIMSTMNIPPDTKNNASPFPTPDTTLVKQGVS